MSDSTQSGSLLPPSQPSVPRVVRSAVPPGKHYEDYKPYLREDFWCSCGYCFMTEAEAMAIRFTIDHYDPRNARPDLEHEYSNLMYACEICNVRKGDRYPPTEARKDGFRFYRADSDIYKEHFQLIGILLRGTSNVGMFSIQMLDLNRQALRRLRELRKRIADSDAFVAEGLAGLRRFPIDRLPKHMRPQALSATKRAAGVAQRVWDELDAILKENSRSPLIGEDAESEERKKARGVRLKEWMAMYEGNWHAPRKGK